MSEAQAPRIVVEDLPQEPRTVWVTIQNVTQPPRAVRAFVVSGEEQQPDAPADRGLWRAIATEVPGGPMPFVAHDGATVWGLGATAADASAAAKAQVDAEMGLHDLEPAKSPRVRVDECTPALARAVRAFAGDVAWRTLADGRLGTVREREDEQHRHARAQRLAEAGRALFGAEWVSPMAAELGVALRTVQRWAAEACTVPDRVLDADLPTLAARAIERGVVRDLETRVAAIRLLALAAKPAPSVPNLMAPVHRERVAAARGA